MNKVGIEESMGYGDGPSSMRTGGKGRGTTKGGESDVGSLTTDDNEHTTKGSGVSTGSLTTGGEGRSRTNAGEVGAESMRGARHFSSQ